MVWAVMQSGKCHSQSIHCNDQLSQTSRTTVLILVSVVMNHPEVLLLPQV